MTAVQFTSKIRLAFRIWCDLALVHFYLRRLPLPQAVAQLGSGEVRFIQDRDPRHLGRIVARLLQIGPFESRCLIKSLVLFRSLRRSGFPAQLVIGLPTQAETTDAHAWVEIEGRDVGPPPGRGIHQELARYQ